MQVLSHGTNVDTFLDSIRRNSRASGKTYLNGMIHFGKFLRLRELTPNTIIPLLRNQEVDVYMLLNEFVSYLEKIQPNLSISTIRLYIAVVRSFLEFFDIDIIASKFRRRVKQPKQYRENEQSIDAEDVRNILLKCTNRRLRAYILMLASSGVRAMEACSLRIQDVDFTTTPTKIHVRKEFSKTRRARDVYISQEATEYLKVLMEWKYRDKPMQSEDLIFSIYFIKNADPEKIYNRLQNEFSKLLNVVEMGERKENSRRHRITLHSMRRLVKTIVSDQAGQDYSEWFLGHNHSPYWGKKEHELSQIYATKCMKYLTFLDYATLEATGKGIEAKLFEKDQEIKILRQKDTLNTDAISTLSDRLEQIVKEIEVLKQKK